MNLFKLKINKIYNLLFGEKFYKKLNFSWDHLPKRYDLINLAIKKRKYEDYLEIGCDENQTFDKIIIKNKTGVDPIKGGNIRKTSDLFFRENRHFFDCIFIDGLHTYAQVKKDLENSFKILKKNGMVFLHDCLPKSYFHQAVPRSRSSWNGDVWKIIVEYRAKSEFDTCTCFLDQGIGIIKKKQNTNILNINKINFEKLKFKEFYYNHHKLMNIIEFKNINNFLEI